jgi:hypothetical protein
MTSMRQKIEICLIQRTGVRGWHVTVAGVINMEREYD